MSTIAFRQARDHVRMFADEGNDLFKAHREAMECFDCESFIQIGIDAYEWLLRADSAMRKAAANDPQSVGPEQISEMQALFRGWFRTSDVGLEWAGELKEKGFDLENYEKFVEYRDEMAAMVRAMNPGAAYLPESLCDLRDEALAEHERGETSEVFPEEE